MTLIQWIRAKPLTSFFIIANAITWPLAALTPVSLVFALVSLFGPAAAALIVARTCDGPAGVSALIASLKRWRVEPIWYALAILLPLAVSALVAFGAVALGLATHVEWTPIGPLSLLLFVLVVGEEIGWRGFALPRMLDRFGVGRASLILGILWGLWHLPTFFLAGAPQSDVPIAVYVAYTTALAGAFTWLWLHTQGSALLATVLHGAVNAVGFTPVGVPPAQKMWLAAGAWAACGLLLLALGQQRRPTLVQSPSP